MLVVNLIGEFIIKRGGKLEKYQNYNDIPNQFEHVISFKPNYPSEPHTEEQHNQISKFDDYLKELISRASGN
jgi:hypothetical protein